MEKAIFVRKDLDAIELNNKYLEQGWSVKLAIPQHGAMAGGGETSTISESRYPILIILQK